jgi:hypothetical protein
MVRAILSISISVLILSVAAVVVAACWNQSFANHWGVEITPRESFFGLACIWATSIVARGAEIKVMVVNHEE